MRINRNYTISKSAIIGDNVQIGANSIIHDNVEIGNNTIVCENCIIGEPNARSYKEDNYINPKTYIGSNSLIRSGSIKYSGRSFGECFTTGNMVSNREGSVFG